jgi:hypothetical protein
MILLCHLPWPIIALQCCLRSGSQESKPCLRPWPSLRDLHLQCHRKVDARPLLSLSLGTTAGRAGNAQSCTAGPGLNECTVATHALSLPSGSGASTTMSPTGAIAREKLGAARGRGGEEVSRTKHTTTKSQDAAAVVVGSARVSCSLASALSGVTAATTTAPAAPTRQHNHPSHASDHQQEQLAPTCSGGMQATRQGQALRLHLTLKGLSASGLRDLVAAGDTQRLGRLPQKDIAGICEGRGGPPVAAAQLVSLHLQGCHELTDEGLEEALEDLPAVSHLTLTTCRAVTCGPVPFACVGWSVACGVPCLGDSTTGGLCLCVQCLHQIAFNDWEPRATGQLVRSACKARVARYLTSLCALHCPNCIMPAPIRE